MDKTTTPHMLSVGDAVNWRGSFGHDLPMRVAVIRIEQTTHSREKHGIEVEAIDWSKVRANLCVVDLDNGHWAYGSQLSPTR